MRHRVGGSVIACSALAVGTVCICLAVAAAAIVAQYMMFCFFCRTCSYLCRFLLCLSSVLVHHISQCSFLSVPASSLAHESSRLLHESTNGMVSACCVAP